MNIVQALNTYRKTISADENAFQVLFFLYKDGATSEADLSDYLGLELPELKTLLRDLYQADLIEAQTPQHFMLTGLGESVCSGFGADKLVAPYLVNGMKLGNIKESLQFLVNWALEIDGESAQYCTRSLRDLKQFTARKGESVPNQYLTTLAFTCAVSPDSSIGAMLQTIEDPTSLFLHFVGHGGSGKTHMNQSLSYYRDAARVHQNVNSVFLDACRSDFVAPEFSEEMRIHVSFRLFRFITTNYDEILESCFNRMSDESKKAIWHSLGDEKTFFANQWKSSDRKKLSTSEYFNILEVASAKSARRYHDLNFGESGMSPVSVKNVDCLEPFDASQRGSLSGAIATLLETFTIQFADVDLDQHAVKDLQDARFLLGQFEERIATALAEQQNRRQSPN